MDRKEVREKYYPGYLKEPVNENCIAFESLWGRKYNCNPAALYEYISENHPEYECVWFFNDADTEIKGSARKVERGTPKYYYYLATAKYFIYNNNMPLTFKKRPGQIIVQTMHGTPFKSFGLDVKDEATTKEERRRVVRRAALWDYLVAQGGFTKKMAWRWFRYDKAVLQTGYPRTDSLYSEDPEKARELKERLGIPEDRKVILYAPTWRDMDSFEMALDLEALKAAAGDRYVLLIRPHYFVASYYNVPVDGDFIYDGNVIDKIEELFPVTDILITDYSSVMFDFELTGKPMIFYAYDMDDYVEKSRGSYFDIGTEAPGALAETTAEVIEAINGIEHHFDKNAERIKRFHEKYLTYECPDSSAKIYHAVFEGGVRPKGPGIRTRIRGIGRRMRRIVSGKKR